MHKSNFGTDPLCICPLGSPPLKGRSSSRWPRPAPCSLPLVCQICPYGRHSRGSPQLTISLYNRPRPAPWPLSLVRSVASLALRIWLTRLSAIANLLSKGSLWPRLSPDRNSLWSSQSAACPCSCCSGLWPQNTPLQDTHLQCNIPPFLPVLVWSFHVAISTILPLASSSDSGSPILSVLGLFWRLQGRSDQYWTVTLPVWQIQTWKMAKKCTRPKCGYCPKEIFSISYYFIWDIDMVGTRVILGRREQCPNAILYSLQLLFPC